jgi:hypothetical protein
MNRSASDLIARLNSRTIYADIVVQKKNTEEGRLLRPTYINDYSAGILANYAEGSTETTVQEFNRYIASAQGSSSLPQAPAAPTILYGTSASGEVTVVFMPGSDGGSAISNYEYSTDGGNSYSAFSPATGAVSTLTITGLTNGTTYSITLKGVNDVGVGAASDVIYITPLPGSQLVLFLDGAFVENASGGVWRDSSGKTKNATLYDSLSWNSANSGYYSFDGQDYAQVPSGFNDFSGGITILAFANFGASTDLWERIIDFGNGAENNNILLAREGVTGNLRFQLYNGVSQAISLNVGLTGGIIENAWGFYAARLDGTNYLLKNQNSSTSGASAVLPTSVTRTNNYIGRSNWIGDDYFNGSIGVLAIYSGALTDAQINAFFNLYKARYFAVPAAPTSLVGTIGNGQVSIAFTAGATGGSPITNYEYSINNGSYSAFSPADTASPVVITGLTNGTTYEIRLRAVNVMGAGTASDPLSVTPATVPSAPTSLVTIPGDGEVAISFSPGTNGGSAITNYKYSLNNGSYSAFSPANTGSTVVISGLTNGTTYQIKLRAVNAVGDGAESLAVSATPVAAVPSGNIYTSPTSNVGVATVTQSPFASGYAYDFNGTSDYLTIAGDDSWAYGTGDFTAEWFQYQTSNGTFPAVMIRGIYFNSSITFGLSIQGSTFYIWLYGGSGGQIATRIGDSNGLSGLTPSLLNNWHHFALVRQDGVLRLYIDGIQYGTNVNNTQNVVDNSQTLYIGAQGSLNATDFYQGYLTNIRIVKGLAVYTGNFTVPTSTLTLTAAANPYGGSNTAAIPAGFTKLLLVPAGDAIAASLTTSLSAYNSASTDDWVKITSSEYSALQTNISGTTKVGLADSYLTGTSGSNGSGLTQNSSALVSNTVTALNVAIPANNYVYAFALRYVTTTPSEGMRVYTNTNTGSTGGYNQVGNVLPSISTAGVSYFVRKGVSTTNGATAGLLGFFTGTKMDYPGSFYGSGGYIGFNNYSSPTPPTMRYLLNSSGSVPTANSTLTGGIPNYGAFQIQGLTTATKQWA